MKLVGVTSQKQKSSGQKFGKSPQGLCQSFFSYYAPAFRHGRGGFSVWCLDRSLENAQNLLNDPVCMKDEWSLTFLQRYDTPAKLVGEESFQLLSCFSAMLQTTTFSDRTVTFGQSERETKTRSHVERMSIETVALRHAACSHTALVAPTRSQSSVKFEQEAVRGEDRALT